MKSRKLLIRKAFLNGPALGVILCRDACLGQGIEQSALTNIGQTHNPTFQTHENILKNQSPTSTIEPKVGIVEVPVAQRGADSDKSALTVQNTAFLQSFVAVLSWG